MTLRPPTTAGAERSGPAASSPVRWERPGPGSWVLDTHHTGPTPSRPVRDLFTEAARTGAAAGFSLLGAPLRTMEIEFVHGRFYRRLVPAVGGDRDLPQPPGPVLWLAARTVPTFRRLERQARRALRDRLWRTELARWRDEWRPSITAANERFAGVDPAALDDAALADHLQELWQHLRETTALHFRLHASDVGPIGLLLAATDEWGLPRSLGLAALAGASPATTAPAAALDEIRATIAAAPAGHDEGADLDAVRALSPAIADLVDAYVAAYGWRLTTGYDLIDRTLAEMPDLLAASMTWSATHGPEGHAAAGGAHAGTPGGDRQANAQQRGLAAVDALRDAVPAEHRAELDELVADARDCYGLRDENGPITYEWPAGLLRRALLEAARRLGPAGSISAPDHVFDATVDETVRLLRRDADAAVPTAAMLAERHRTRMGWTDLTPPPTLGPPESFPPAWAMPPAMRRLVGATLAIVELLDADEPAPATSTTTSRAGAVAGTGIGATSYTGRATLVVDPDDLLSVEPGDVLITAMTVPTFNAVLTTVGGLVVEEGGPMSHAAVMARELGIPAVIGAGGALSRFDSGDSVTVDPVRGVAEVAETPR